MISYLRGKVIEKDIRYCIIDTGGPEGGLGYKVHATEELLKNLKKGDSVAVWTHFAVREDSNDLYGFADQESLRLFEMLINISGIGPKTALGVINVASPATLRRAVSSGDLAYLTKVSGIGRKLAEKIIMELREKIPDTGEGLREDLKDEADALEALKSLGYSEREARDSLKKVSESGKENISAGEKVKKALKILGTTK